MSIKSLAFLPILTLSLHAAEPFAEAKKEYIRVEEDEKAARLQTSIVTLEKDGKTVDLIGAIHIADKAYYTKLNERFTQYDRLLFEMVGGEKLQQGEKDDAPKASDAEPEIEEKEEPNNLSGLKDIYSMVAKFLQLSGQSETIDYKAKNFVHADLTLKEFNQKQKERNESLLGLALKANTQDAQAKQPDPARLMAAMLSGNSNRMKLELIHTLGQGDDQVSMFAGETVIVTDRNAKCLEVMEQQLAAGHKKLGIFYGSAHFPDMEKTLMEQGWKRSGEEWLTAWDIPKTPAKAKTPAAPADKKDDQAEPKKKAA
jgi:hypothetical protein